MHGIFQNGWYSRETIPEKLYRVSRYNRFLFARIFEMVLNMSLGHEEVDSMKIGFIGAGKMGFTLGRHFTEYARNVSDEDKASADKPVVMGYFSRNPESAKEAAEFTDTNYYTDLKDLVEVCDTIFVTVPDGQIAAMAQELGRLDVSMEHKIICHTSGALSSQVFSGMDSHVYGYSVHPIYAVNSKTESYINFSDCFITIEGHERYLNDMVEFFRTMGHSVKTISADDKAKYHGAAVFSSNLVIGLYHMATKLLVQCGFDESEAEQALKPLFKNNADNLYSSDCFSALTGPVARCDIGTVEKHLSVLSREEALVYGILSRELIEIVSGRNEYNYDELSELIKKNSSVI